MKHSTLIFSTSGRPGLMIILVTAAVIGLAVFLLTTPLTGTDREIPFGVTNPTVIENTPLPEEITTHAVGENISLTEVGVNAKAVVTAGRLEYQIKGQNSVSVEKNAVVPVGTEVKVWSDGEMAMIRLDDSSAIKLNPSTILNLVNVKQSTGYHTIRVILLRGSILIASENFWVISGDYQYRIQVKKSMAGVSYDPLQHTIAVNCLGQRGSCSFYTSNDLNELAPGQQLDYKESTRGKVKSADFEGWQVSIEEILPTPTFTQTPIITQTPILTPTRTPTPTPTKTPGNIPTVAATPNDDSMRREPKPHDGGDGGKGG